MMVAGLAVAAITIASGVLHGRQTHRWGTPHALQAAAQELESFPRTIGHWEAVGEEEIGAATLKVLHDPGYLVRSYRNRITGETVKLAVLVGPPGPMAVHSPEICYSSQAYSSRSEPATVTLERPDSRGSHEFWRLSLEPQAPAEPPLVVYYAWSTGERWEAARHPRFTYGSKRFLYKLQLAAIGSLSSGGDRGDAGRRFLEELLAVDFRLPVAE